MVVQRFLPEEPPEGSTAIQAYRGQVRVAAYGTFAASALAARPLQRLVAQQPGERVARGVVRGYLQRLEVISTVGLMTAGTLDVALSLSGAEHLSAPRRRLLATGLTLAAGTALATFQVHRDRQRQARATGEPAPALAARSVLVGAGTAVGLTALGRAESIAARGVRALLPDGVPSAVGSAVGHGVCLGLLGGARLAGGRAAVRPGGTGRHHPREPAHAGARPTSTSREVRRAARPGRR